MTLRISAAFAKQFKCPLGTGVSAMPQGRQLNSWSCHFIRLRRKPLIFVMNDATLYAFLIPATGVKNLAQAWVLIRVRISDLWNQYGISFTENDATPFLLPRNNRSLIGSMTDATDMLNHYDFDDKEAGIPINFSVLEHRANLTTYKALGFYSASQKIAEVLGEIREQ